MKKEIVENTSLRGIKFTSGDDMDYAGCRLVLFLPERCIIYKFDKPWVKPLAYKIGDGDKSYEIMCPREYSLLMFHNESHVSVRYGVDYEDINSMMRDAPKSKCFGFIIPWREYVYIGQRFYDEHGKEHFIDKDRNQVAAEDSIIEDVSVNIDFIDDYDNEFGTAKIYITEREWSLGSSWCSWLKWFKPNMVHRCIEMEFNIETGARKGSWKGGITAMNFAMLDGESLLGAFSRCCDKYGLSLAECGD